MIRDGRPVLSFLLFEYEVLDLVRPQSVFIPQDLPESGVSVVEFFLIGAP